MKGAEKLGGFRGGGRKEEKRRIPYPLFTLQKRGEIRSPVPGKKSKKEGQERKRTE